MSSIYNYYGIAVFGRKCNPTDNRVRYGILVHTHQVLPAENGGTLSDIRCALMFAVRLHFQLSCARFLARGRSFGECPVFQLSRGLEIESDSDGLTVCVRRGRPRCAHAQLCMVYRCSTRPSSGPRAVQPAAPVPAGHGPVGRCVCCPAGGDFGPAVRCTPPAPPGQRTNAGKGHVHEFHLNDILLVRACKAVLGLLQVVRMPTLSHESPPPPP